MAGTQREVERKYVAGVDAVLPDLSSMGPWAPARRDELRAEYFDTPDLALTRAGWSLRRRTGGDDAGWHLKSPASGDVRIEVHRPLGPRVPSDLRALVSGVVGSQPLFGVAVLKTARATSDLLGPHGVRAHLGVDSVVARVGADSSGWDEIEVELALDEPPSTLDEVEAALTASGIERAPHRSKVAKALAGALAVRATELVPDSPAGLVLLAAAEKHIGTFQAFEDAVLVDAPDAVHKSRVATRRLRGLLTTFAPLLEEGAATELVGELRWFGEILGHPRDAEVLKEQLLAAVAELNDEAGVAVAGRLAERLDARHAAAHSRLVETMAGERYAELCRGLADFLAGPPLSPAAHLPARTAFAAPLTSAVRRARRRDDAARRAPAELARWHDTRKAAKAVRYSAEALVKPFGPPAASFASAWEVVTERLGEAQDTVAADEALAELAEDAPDKAPYEALRAGQAGKRQRALQAGREALDAARALGLDWLS